MCFDVVGDVLEGNVLMEIQGINDFTVVLVGSKPSWLVCPKSKESIVSPATYLGRTIYIERSDRVDQVRPGEVISSTSFPGVVGSGGYTTTCGQVMICVDHFTSLGGVIHDAYGTVVGITTRMSAQLAEVTMNANAVQANPHYGKPVRSNVVSGQTLCRDPTFQTPAITGTIVRDQGSKWILQAAPGPVVSRAGDSNMVWDSPGGTHAVGVHNSFRADDRSMSVYKLCRSRAVLEQIAGGQVQGQKRKTTTEQLNTEPNKRVLRSGASYGVPKAASAVA